MSDDATKTGDAGKTEDAATTDAAATPAAPAPEAVPAPEPPAAPELAATAADAPVAVPGDFSAVLTDLGFAADQIASLQKEGVKTEDDMRMLSADEIRSVTGCGLVTAKKAAGSFAKQAAPAAEAPQAPGVFSLEVLPALPDDYSFTEMLKTGGVLKVGKVEVIAAVRAAMAQSVGLFDLPDVITTKMEAWAEAQEEPVGENFYRLNDLISTRRYADVLSAIGVKGRFMSETRKNKFLSQVGQLWPMLRGYQDHLVAWQTSWTESANTGAMANLLGSMNGMMMPPVTPPDAQPLRMAAEGVMDGINRIFAGHGIPVARALAYDAGKIKEALEDPTLPVSVGATNHEQMIKMLGANVSSDMVLLEMSVTRFAMAVMGLKDVVPGTQQETSYLWAMWQLGRQIQWDRLTSTAPKGGPARKGGAFLDDDK